MEQTSVQFTIVRSGCVPFDANFERLPNSVEVFQMKFVSDHFTRTLQVVAVLICLTTIAVSAEAPHWVRAISSTGSGNGCDQNQCDDVAYAVKVGPDNDVYVTGRFSGTIQFAGTTLVSAGGLDFFLAKYSRSGKLLWIVQTGGPGDDYALGVDIDKAGNAYVTGAFTDSAVFGSTNGAGQTATGASATIFLAKYSPSGVLAWVQTGVGTCVFTPGVNNGFGIAVDRTADTVYIVTVSGGDVTFSSADGTPKTVPGVCDWHMVLAKFDSEGNFEWGQVNASTINSIPYGVAVDEKHNVYVTGWFEDTGTFFSNDGNDITVVGFSPAQSTLDYPDDCFLAKYDKDGNAKWVNHIGGYKAVGSAVAVSPRGEVSIVGFVGNINSGSSSEAVTIATSQPPGAEISLGGGDITDPFNKDVFVATYNDNGVLLRALRKGTSRDEVATSAAYDRKGHLYVTGVFQGNTAPQNVFVMKFAGRKLLWTKVATNAGVWVGNNTVISPAISVGKKGGIFVTGAYQGTASFGGITLQGTGAADIFLAELAPD